MRQPSFQKLTLKQQKLASKFISQVMREKKYPKKQAIAIGLSKARQSNPGSLVERLSRKYGR